MDISPLLNSALIKVDRAAQHLNEFKLELQRFNDSKPYQFVYENDLDTGERVCFYEPTIAIPAYWAILVGEIVFHLRSALDHAVYSLTVHGQSIPLEQTEFPIFNDKIKFFAAKKDGTPVRGSGVFKIRGLSQKTKDFIETKQPFSIGQDVQDSVLMAIQELCNIDKHRTLHIFGKVRNHNAKYNAKGIKFRIFRINTLWNLDERTEMLRWLPPLSSKSEVEMDAEFSTAIVFNERTSTMFKEPIEVTVLLELCLQNVIHTIVEMGKSLK